MRYIKVTNFHKDTKLCINIDKIAAFGESFGEPDLRFILLEGDIEADAEPYRVTESLLELEQKIQSASLAP